MSAPTAAATSNHPFRVVLTGDFFDTTGKMKYPDIGLDLLRDAGIEYRQFPEHRPEIGPDQLAGAQGAIVLTPRVSAKTLASASDFLAIARFGVGFDAVDVPACTAADVALLITVGAVDRPVAEATVGWMLALSHHVRIKDQLVREGRWDDRSRYMGSELRERTLGVIGCGGIGRSLMKLLSGFGMNRPLVFDPFIKPETLAELGADAANLDDLLRNADYVSIHCPLNEQTRNLIGARELSLMKSNAFLLNTARGGIVNEDALHAALVERRISGAALDCFSVEPITQTSRWTTLENVLLAPHSIAWTNELFRDIGRTACRGLIDFAEGRRPKGVVNPEVFDRPTFRAKWDRLCGKS